MPANTFRQITMQTGTRNCTIKKPAFTKVHTKRNRITEHNEIKNDAFRNYTRSHTNTYTVKKRIKNETI